MIPPRIRKILRRIGVPEPPFQPRDAESECEGVRVLFRLNSREDEQRIARFGGERDYIADMVRMAGPSDVFWDVGSFLGMVAAFCARKGARVVAVEPDPDFARRVREHAGMNSLANIQVLECGLGEADGELSLNTGGEAGWAPSFFEKGLAGHRTVPVRRLDGIIARGEAPAPTILKIDVEGFERRVLRGGMKALASPALRLLFLEVHPVFMLENGESLAELFAAVEQAGFRGESCRVRNSELHFVYRRKEA